MFKQLAVLSEESTLVSLAATEPEAFGALYDRYFPQVYNFIRYRVGDPHTADDLTAVVFEKVLVNLPRYRAGAVPFAVWLFKITRNAVTDHYRRESRRRSVPLEHLPEQEAEGPGPMERVLEHEIRKELLAAVHRLEAREQEILALKFAARLTNREIAKAVGLSESNVGVILFRIIRRLRKELYGGDNREES